MASKVVEYKQLAVSLGATVRTTALNVLLAERIGYQIRTSGTAVGDWTVQYSNDYDPAVDDPTVDTKWDTYTLTSTIPSAAGVAQTFGVVLDDYEYKYVRIKFTRTSGTGSLDIFCAIKGSY